MARKTEKKAGEGMFSTIARAFRPSSSSSAAPETADPRIAGDILTYLLAQFPSDFNADTLKEKTAAVAALTSNDVLPAFLEAYVAFQSAWRKAVPTGEPDRLREIMLRAFSSYEGAAVFLLLAQDEKFQLAILEECLADHIGRRLLADRSPKKVQGLIDRATADTILKGVAADHERLQFGHAEALFLKLPPEWLRLVHDTLSLLIKSLYGELRNEIGEDAAKEYVGKKLQSLGASLEMLPAFRTFLRSLPPNLVADSYVEEMSKAELEEQVSVRTEELSKNSARLAKLLAENELLAAFPRNNPNPILGADADGAITYANPAAEQAVAEFKLTNVEGLLPPSHHSYLSECLASGKHHRAEVALMGRTFEWLYVPFKDQRTVHLYASDISSKKQLEVMLGESAAAAKLLVRKDQEVSEANQGLMTLNKELSQVGKELVKRDLELTEANTRLVELDQMKSEFVSVAAHQLRTPLTGIRWTLGGLANHEFGDLTEKQEQFIQTALKTVISAVELINDLLNVARIEEGRFGFVMKPGSVTEAVRSSVQRFEQRAIEKGLRITLEVSSDPPPIPMDREKLEMVFDNLIDNAIKYSEPGRVISVGLWADAERIRVTVTDGGIGIPQADLHKLFSKFFRAHNALLFHTSGTGLGLYIIKNIVEHHKGDVACESQEGKGTTFTITLPIRKIDEKAEAITNANESA